MKKQDVVALKLPDTPGVYFFRDSEGAILYIGKATSLKDRVRSYYNPDLIKTRGPRLVSMVVNAGSVTYQETGSVLEALLLESKLIKDNNPPYNAKEKDDKSFTCVVITTDTFPRIFTMRIRDYEKKFTKKDIAYVYGPFTSLPQLRIAMKIIRKIFPYSDTCQEHSPKPCFNAQIKLCPGICTGKITEKDYLKNISNIRKLFDGKKTEIKTSLEKDMKEYVKRQEFEKAAEARDRLFAIDHIKDISLIKEDRILSFKDTSFRIEAYDAAHISGTSRVGVMVVMDGGHIEKSEFRKFKLEENVNDDYEGLRQIMARRFSHKEWRYPDLIVIDGGLAHKQVAEKVLASLSLAIPCVSVVKNEKHKPKDILGDKVHVDYHTRDILLANQEAHRFAITYHKTLRDKLVK